MKKTAWLVVGAGAIGLFWACKLEKLGYPVHLVYRTDKPGKKITLDSFDEDDPQQPVVSTHKIKSFKVDELSKQYEQVLFCTKAYDLNTAFQSVQHCLTEHATIACLCNGMGAQQLVQKQLKSSQTLWAGVTSEGALKLDVNRVKHTGFGDTYFGLWDSTLEEANFPIESLQITNIHQKLIEKLAINAVINPITAVFGLYNGEVLDDDYANLFHQALAELDQLFSHPKFLYSDQSQHLTLDTLTHRVSNVAKLTRLNRSSMHEDIRLHRPTENQFISGFLIDNSPIEMPIQTLLYQAVKCEEHEPLEKLKKKLLSVA